MFKIRDFNNIYTYLFILNTIIILFSCNKIKNKADLLVSETKSVKGDVEEKYIIISTQMQTIYLKEIQDCQ